MCPLLRSAKCLLLFCNRVRSIKDLAIFFPLGISPNYTYPYVYLFEGGWRGPCLWIKSRQEQFINLIGYDVLFPFSQVTVFPTVNYHHCKDCTGLVTESVVFISSDLQHDASAVHHMTSLLVGHLRSKRGLDIHRQVCFTAVNVYVLY